MFDYKKHYVFSVDRFIIDRKLKGKDYNKDCELWAYKTDGKYVKYVSANVGICNGYVVHPDWCIEVDPYDI